MGRDWMEQKLQLTLITGRTIDQGVGKELGKSSQEYYDTAALCFLDPQDMIKLGIKNGSTVQISSRFGSVTVKAKHYPRGCHIGLAFIPCGLWANAVCGDDTYSMGMPLFKGFPITVEAAAGTPILTLDELLEKEFGKIVP
jgi:formylmethanofuran dehydrogenase subunit D